MDLHSFPEWLTALATLAAVIIGTWQLYLTRRELQKSSEDALNKEYRAIVAQLPVTAMLKEPLSDEQVEKHLSIFYQYFDLSNQQLYLIKKKRINRETAKEWEDGITQNLERPSFISAWASLQPRLGESFDELRDYLELQK